MFDKMKAVGELTAQCITELKDVIKPGISTYDIERYVRAFQEKHKLNNSQYGYFGFQGYCCTSVNEEMCHAIPMAKQVLKSGDIVSVDVTFNLNGAHGDACYTYPVGDITDDMKLLLTIARDCLTGAINKAQPGYSISDIGTYVEDLLRSASQYYQKQFSVAKEYTGHCIGTSMHMGPQIPHHYMPEYEYQIIREGMFFTVEPIIVMGNSESYTKPNGWTVVTKDRSWAAQFEKTIAITKDGPVDLTPW